MNENIVVTNKEFSDMLLSVGRGNDDSRQIICHVSALDNDSDSSVDSINLYFDSIVKELDLSSNSPQKEASFQQVKHQAPKFPDKDPENLLDQLLDEAEESSENLQEIEMPIIIIQDSDSSPVPKLQSNPPEPESKTSKPALPDSVPEANLKTSNSSDPISIKPEPTFSSDPNLSASPSASTCESSSINHKTDSPPSNPAAPTGKLMKISIENSLTQMAKEKNIKSKTANPGQSACAKCFIF